ncbi:MAG: hypothetical protein J6K55_02720 [Clostridia bacterium]|nr:hypothetical protein [Clostridia bacterium]
MHDNGVIMVNLLLLPIAALLLYIAAKNLLALIAALRSIGSDAPRPWQTPALRIWVCCLLLSLVLFMLGESSHLWRIRALGSSLMKTAFLPLMPVIWFFVDVL